MNRYTLAYIREARVHDMQNEILTISLSPEEWAKVYELPKFSQLRLLLGRIRSREKEKGRCHGLPAKHS